MNGILVERSKIRKKENFKEQVQNIVRRKDQKKNWRKKNGRLERKMIGNKKR